LQAFDAHKRCLIEQNFQKEYTRDHAFLLQPQVLAMKIGKTIKDARRGSFALLSRQVPAIVIVYCALAVTVWRCHMLLGENKAKILPLGTHGPVVNDGVLIAYRS
jgi:hypothetical protein